jgi:hypothetical protein
MVPETLPLKLPVVCSTFSAASVPEGVSPPGKPETLKLNKLGLKNKLFVAPKLDPDLN